MEFVLGLLAISVEGPVKTSVMQLQLHSFKLVKGKKTNFSFPIKCLNTLGVLYGHSRSPMNSHGLGKGTTL